MRSTQARLKALLESRAMRPLLGSISSRPGPPTRFALRALCSIASACLFAAATPAAPTQPFIWDQDTNGIDDRIESVHANGFSASFELGDTTLRQRILVTRALGDLLFSVYVRWDHTPTTADIAALALLGMPVLSRIEA